MTEKIAVSVVMPSMNEEGSVAKVIDDIREHGRDYDLEIVLVDSSRDRTAEIAEAKGAKVIRQLPPAGPGKALILGLRESRGDVAITGDCDDTYPMADIPKFVALWQQGNDFVNGNRLHAGNDLSRSMPLMNRFGNWVFALMVRLLYGVPTRDVTTGMRLFSRRLIESEDWECNLSFWTEIVIKCKQKGFQFIEVPIRYAPRVGESKLNAFRSGRAFVLCIFKYRFGLNFISRDLL